jgi:hypothetical protein
MARFIVSPLSAHWIRRISTDVCTSCVDLVIRGIDPATFGHFRCLIQFQVQMLEKLMESTSVAIIIGFMTSR